jgi:cytochrome c oxidase cbb3-type subunit IV
MDLDIGVARGLLTAILLVLFLGIWAWSWSRKRKKDFDEAAQLPLEDDSRPPAKSKNKEQTP